MIVVEIDNPVPGTARATLTEQCCSAVSIVPVQKKICWAVERRILDYKLALHIRAVADWNVDGNVRQ